MPFNLFHFFTVRPWAISVYIRNRMPFPVEVKSTAKPDNLPAGLRSFLNHYPQTTRAFVMNPSLEAEVRCGQTRGFFRKIGEMGSFGQWLDD